MAIVVGVAITAEVAEPATGYSRCSCSSGMVAPVAGIAVVAVIAAVRAVPVYSCRCRQ